MELIDTTSTISPFSSGCIFYQPHLSPRRGLAQAGPGPCLCGSLPGLSPVSPGVSTRTTPKS